MLAQLVAATKSLAAKVGTSVHLACMPYCPPAHLVSPPVLLVPTTSTYFVEVDLLQTNIPGVIYLS
jgi:hypothetical protein